MVFIFQVLNNTVVQSIKINLIFRNHYSYRFRFFLPCFCQGYSSGHDALLNVRQLAIVGQVHSFIAHQKVVVLSFRVCGSLDFNPNVSILYSGVYAFWPEFLGLWELIILGICYCQPFLSLGILIFLVKLADWNNASIAR